MVGMLVGVLLIGGLVDKYGRKFLWVISYFVNGGFVFFFGLLLFYYIFVVFRFFVGIFVGGGGLIIFVLVIEFIGFLYRGMKVD